MAKAILLGPNRVTEEEVFNVPDVPFTKSFHPVSHRDFIMSVKESIRAVGLDIVSSEYVLSAGGHQMFSVYDLNCGSSDLCWSIGLRNSLDKSLSIGVCAGTRVFVCSNLCFSGDVLIFRRHTGKLDTDELAFLAFRAMRSMIPKLQAFQRWHEGLKKYPLLDTDFRILLVEILANNVIPASKFHQFNDLYAKIYDDSIWGFHETVTDILRESNLMLLPKKNLILNGIINQYIDLLKTVMSNPLGDFYQQRCCLSH